MPSPADDFFAAAFAMATAIHERHVAHQKALRDASNTRRRERYAAQKAAGTLPRPQPPAEVEVELDRDPGCYCHLGHPPCGWCEDGGVYCDDCGEPVNGGETCDNDHDKETSA